jgi:hypothetical protein
MPKKHVVNGFNSKFGNKDSLKLTFQHKQKNAEAKEDNLKEDPAVVVNSKLFGGVQKKKQTNETEVSPKHLSPLL